VVWTVRLAAGVYRFRCDPHRTIMHGSCTFPDKPAAVAELARVLRPGGRLALSDLAARTAELPPSLT
jgi:ubiquinone/menaquinone biosynthesis C-methylase UbiE